MAAFLMVPALEVMSTVKLGGPLTGANVKAFSNESRKNHGLLAVPCELPDPTCAQRLSANRFGSSIHCSTVPRRYMFPLQDCVAMGIWPVTFPFWSYVVPDWPITPPSSVAISGCSFGTLHRTAPDWSNAIIFCCPFDWPTVPTNDPS